jgi:hypothetical protein
MGSPVCAVWRAGETCVIRPVRLEDGCNVMRAWAIGCASAEAEDRKHPASPFERIFRLVG